MGAGPSYMMMANQRQIALARHEADAIPVHQPNTVPNQEDNDDHSIRTNPQSEDHSQNQPQDQPQEQRQEQPTSSSSSSSSSCPAPLHKHSRKESLSEYGHAAIDKKYEAKRAEAASWYYAHCDRLEQSECRTRERREQQQRIDEKYHKKLEKIEKKHNKTLEKVDEKTMKLEGKKSRSRASSSAKDKLSRKYSTGETLDTISRARTDDADEKQPRRKSFKDRLRALSSPSSHHTPVAAGPPSRPLATGGGAPAMVGVGLGGV